MTRRTDSTQRGRSCCLSASSLPRQPLFCIGLERAGSIGWITSGALIAYAHGVSAQIHIALDLLRSPRSSEDKCLERKSAERRFFQTPNEEDILVSDSCFDAEPERSMDLPRTRGSRHGLHREPPIWLDTVCQTVSGT